MPTAVAGTLATIGALVPGLPITTTLTATLREAAAVLVDEYKGVLLVLGQHGLVGVLSERDVVRSIADGDDPDEIRVEDVMTEDLVKIDIAASVTAAVALMNANEIRHLVVTRDGAPVGLLSMRDVLRSLPWAQ